MSTISGILMTVVLPVVGVWTVGFFLIIFITVVKVSSRNLQKLNSTHACVDVDV